METPIAETEVAMLPKFQTLVADGLHFAKNRRDIWWWTLVMMAVGITLFAVPVASLILIPTLVDAHGGVSAVVWGLSVLSILSSIASMWIFIMLGGAMTYASSAATQVTFWDGWRWMRSHFWAYVWVATLIMFVALGGFTLFIIPGMIMALYLTFAYQVIMFEGVRGKAALVRSIELVYGRWWAIFGRITGAWLVGFIIINCIVLVLQTVFEIGVDVFSPTMAIANSSTSILFAGIEVVRMILNIFMSIYMLHVLGNIFRSTQALPQITTGTFLPRTCTVLAWFGALVALALPFGIAAIVAITTLQASENNFDLEAELLQFETAFEEKSNDYSGE